MRFPANLLGLRGHDHPGIWARDGYNYDGRPVDAVQYLEKTRSRLPAFAGREAPRSPLAKPPHGKTGPLIRIVALVGAFLFFIVPALFATEAAILVTEEVQLRVADAFMEEKEYYRAITEYKRYLILFPDSARGDHAIFQTGIAYLDGGDSDGAVKTLQALQERYPVSPYAEASVFYTGVAHWKAKRTREACSTFLNIMEKHPDSPYAPQALIAASLVELDAGDIEASRDLLDRFVSDYPDRRETANVHEAITIIDQYGELPQKSEVLAGILSAVIPGAGYAYAGDYGTAFMSFAVNGAFIAAAWTAFAQELYAVGALAGGVGAPFYIGNIYGSALAVKKANMAVRQEMRERIYALLGAVFEQRIK